MGQQCSGQSICTNSNGQMVAVNNRPTSAQLVFQGPLHVGQNGPVTQDELLQCRMKLEELKNTFNLREPVRGYMDDENYLWRHGKRPDYTLANLTYLMGKTQNHAEGSLEQVVEDMVKTWEFERSHKADCKKHKTVDHEVFRISANGAKKYDNNEANSVGNYNVLLAGANKELYDAEKLTWEDSHEAFHKAFVAFPWEVLQIFTGPPKVSFSWRHWGHKTGSYKGVKGNGELVEMYGWGTADVHEKDGRLQFKEIEIFYDMNLFLEVMEGKRPATDTAAFGGTPGCPYIAKMQQSA